MSLETSQKDCEDKDALIDKIVTAIFNLNGKWISLKSEEHAKSAIAKACTQ
jgi:hypothetical protein